MSLRCLIGQVREDSEVDPVLGKALGILGHPEVREPLRDLLHCRPTSGLSVCLSPLWEPRTKPAPKMPKHTTRGKIAQSPPRPPAGVWLLDRAGFKSIHFASLTSPATLPACPELSSIDPMTERLQCFRSSETLR